MTVEGLNKLLQPAASNINIFKDFNGLFVGIDMFFWLHQLASAPTTAQTLLKGEASPSNCPILKGTRRRIQRLQAEGLGVVCVFDGDPYPAKNSEDAKRAKERCLAAVRANKAIAEKGVLGVARKDVLLLANDVRKHVNRVITHVLIPLGVGYFVAPYEADHQLAILYELDI
jgi:hypothetical protein